MLKIPQQKLAYIVRTHLPAHGGRGARHHRIGRLDLILARSPVGQRGNDLAPGFGPRFNKEKMFPFDEHLGERQIEPGFGLRTRLHRNAKACAARVAAVHRNDKGILAPCAIVWIDMLTA